MAEHPTPDHATGIVHGLSNEAYHAGPGLSHSGVKRLLRTPFHYWGAQHAGAPHATPTPQMLNGTLVHCALLEPAEFDARYIVGPDADKRTKEWREFARHVADSGATVIDKAQRERAFAQADALRTLPEVAELMAAGESEVSAYWTDPTTGVLCKCRPDHVTPVGDGRSVVLLDVKTAADASEEGFKKSASNYGYHTQADWYCTGYALAAGVEVHGMVFAAVEPEYPHACAAYMLDDDSLMRARKRNTDALRTYARCAAAAEWPGYPRSIQVITLHPWA